MSIDTLTRPQHDVEHDSSQEFTEDPQAELDDLYTQEQQDEQSTRERRTLGETALWAMQHPLIAIEHLGQRITLSPSEIQAGRSEQIIKYPSSKSRNLIRRDPGEPELLNEDEEETRLAA